MFYCFPPKSCQMQWLGGHLWRQSRACPANLLDFVSFGLYHCMRGWLPQQDGACGHQLQSIAHLIKIWYERVKLELPLMHMQVPVHRLWICVWEGFFKLRHSPVILKHYLMHRGSGTGFLANINQSSSSGHSADLYEPKILPWGEERALIMVYVCVFN